MFAAHTTPAMQMVVAVLAIALLGALIASVVALVREWRRAAWRAAIPLLACAAAWPVAHLASAQTTDLLFAQHLPIYEALVARPDVQGVASGSGLEQLTLSQSEGEYMWWAAAERTPDGTLMVELMNGSGFPVKHSGFVYTSSGSIPLGSNVAGRYSYWIPMRANWFAVSD